MKVIVGASAPIELGTTETAPTIGITDYSRRVTDDFGVTTVVERGFARRLSARLALPFEQVDGIQRLLAELRATPAQWVADDRFAWLSLTGFYKEFEVDLNVPPVSYCTLTVEGLTESAAVEDAGEDPAPEGSESTFRMLRPVSITDSVLTASSVAENDHPVWAAGTSYPLGYRVIRTGTHRIYESLSAGNIGNDPSSTPSHWLDVGPTNRWAMFDEALGTATSSGSGSIVVTFAAGAVDAVALLDVTGSSARVEVTAAGEVDPAYDRTIEAEGGTVGFYDLPAIAGTVRVTIVGSGAVSVGTLLIGDLVGLGITEASPSAGITDYSRKQVDDFGEVTIVQRAWAKRMAAKALIRSDAVDTVADRIAAVRARPVLWIGNSGLDSLTIYGFFREFSIEVGEAVSKLSLSIEGLSKAAPLLPVVDLSPLSLRIEEVEAELARVTSDDLLGRAEKPKAIIDWNALSSNLSALIGRYTALGSPSDITAHRDDAVAKFDALTAYLGGLAPSWTDTDQDTPINPVIYKARWVDAYAAVAVFSAAITGRPGASALVGYLTNENHTVPANSAGGVISYAGGEGEFKVFYGALDVTAECAFSVVSGYQPADLNCPINSVANEFFAGPKGAYRLGGLSADVGFVNYRATHPVHGAVVRRFSLSKSRGGTSPPLISLTASRHDARFDGVGTYIGGDITFTAVHQNILGNSAFRVNRVSDGAMLNADTAAGYAAGAPAYWSSSGPYNLTMKAQAVRDYIVAHGPVTITAYSDGVPVSDSVTIYKVQDGAAGQNVALVKIYKRAPAGSPPALPTATATFTFASYSIDALNNGWTLHPQAANGEPQWVSAAPASGPGATDTIAAGEWAGAVIDSQDGADGGNGTGGMVVMLYQRNNTGIPPALPTATLTVDLLTGAISGPLGAWSQDASDPSGGKYLFRITAAALATAPATTDTIAAGEWGAARQIAKDGDPGPPGANAKALMIDADRKVIRFDGRGVLSPASQTTTFTLTKQNLSSGTVTVSMAKADGTAIDANAYLTGSGSVTPSGASFTQTGGTLTMTAAAFSAARGTTQGVKIVVTHADGLTATWELTSVSDGEPAQQGRNAALGTPGTAGYAPAAGTVTMNVAAGTTITMGLLVNYSMPVAGSGRIQAKLEYRNVSDGGAWTQVGGDLIGSFASNSGGPEPVISDGACGGSATVPAPSATKVYEFRIEWVTSHGSISVSLGVLSVSVT